MALGYKEDKIIQIQAYYVNRPSIEDSAEVVYGLTEGGKLVVLEDEYEKDEKGKIKYNKETGYPKSIGKKWVEVRVEPVMRDYPEVLD